MSKQKAIEITDVAIRTAGGVHGRNSGNQDLQDLANAVRQVALAIKELAEAVG
jgi:hypothetical protein